MRDTELYAGFDPVKQREYEDYLVTRYGKVAEDRILESKKRTQNWGKEEYEAIKREGDEIHKALIARIEGGLGCESNEVQVIIQRHYQMIERFYGVGKDAYVGLSELYCDHPEFRKFYDDQDPRLAEFLREAMRVFAAKNLN